MSHSPSLKEPTRALSTGSPRYWATSWYMGSLAVPTNNLKSLKSAAFCARACSCVAILCALLPLKGVVQEERVMFCVCVNANIMSGVSVCLCVLYTCVSVCNDDDNIGVARVMMMRMLSERKGVMMMMRVCTRPYIFGCMRDI